MRTETLTTDSLNTKLLLKTLMAFKPGDFSVRLPGENSFTLPKVVNLDRLPKRSIMPGGSSQLISGVGLPKRLQPTRDEPSHDSD